MNVFLYCCCVNVIYIFPSKTVVFYFSKKKKKLKESWMIEYLSLFFLRYRVYDFYSICFNFILETKDVLKKCQQLKILSNPSVAHFSQTFHKIQIIFF